jgi:hypothetical protein
MTFFSRSRARDDETVQASAGADPKQGNLIEVYPVAYDNGWNWNAIIRDNVHISGGSHIGATPYDAVIQATEALVPYQLKAETGEAIVPQLVFHETHRDYVVAMLKRTDRRKAARLAEAAKRDNES